MSASVPAAELCAGYSGLLLAMKAAGWPVEPEWLSETDTDASKVLDFHHPGVPNLGDLTAVDWKRVPEAEVVAGGIPCTGWSLIGQRLGSKDERDLWPIRRADDGRKARRGAVDMLRVLRPRVFLLENVARLVNAEAGVPWLTILSDLRALGYNAGWVTVGACRVGACHHRHRVFLIATLGEVVPPDGLLFGVALSAAAQWPTSGLMVDGQVWPLEVPVCGSPVPGGVLLPTPRTSDTNGAGLHGDGGPDLRTVVSMLPDTPSAAGRFGVYEAAVRFHEARFGMSSPAPTEMSPEGNRRLSPAFPEWMLGLAPGWLTEVVDRAAAIRMAGNGVSPRQGALAIRLLSQYMPNLMPARVELGVAA